MKDTRLRHQGFQSIALTFSFVLLLSFAGCGGGGATQAAPSPTATATPTATPTPSPSAVPIDYSLAQSWVTLPNASQAVDVFFLYPTTYGAQPGTLGPTWTPGWNQSLAQAAADTHIQYHVTSKTGIFTRAGTNLYVPYYQQSSGLDVLNALLYSATPQNVTAATEAMQVAYTDVANAFDYYMAHFNKDASGNPRPFILAGHSQGSNLLLMLLENKFSDPSLRQQLVAAYVIGWSVTSDDMSNYPASLPLLGICGNATQTGCIVTYNTQAYAGDWTQAPGTPKVGLVRTNAYSVNPLTWVATGPGATEPAAAPASANLGALFYLGQLGSNPVPPFSLDPDTGDYTFEIASYTGAQNNNGALVVDASALPAPANQSNLAPPYNVLPMFHSYDFNFFYRNLEQNVVDRVGAYEAQ